MKIKVCANCGSDARIFSALLGMFICAECHSKDQEEREVDNRPKPLLGIMPEFLWREYRARDLYSAIGRSLGVNDINPHLLGMAKEMVSHLEFIIKTKPPQP